MPDNTTYINNITAGDVSLFMEQMLLAPEGTAWTPGRVDVSSPPAGFIHMGAIVSDSPQLTVQKENYQLATGIPMTLRYQATVRIVGEFQMIMHSNRNSRLITALGGLDAFHFPTGSTTWGTIAATVFATGINSIAPQDRTRIQINSTAGTSTWLGNLKAGDVLVTDTAANIHTTLNEAFVEKVVDATSPSGAKVVTLAGPHGFPLPPVDAAPVYVIERDEVPLGTSQIPYYHILGVADALNGTQIIHQMEKASPRGQFVETLQSAQDARIPAIFDLFGYSVSTPFANESHIAVAARHWFSPTRPGQ